MSDFQPYQYQKEALNQFLKGKDLSILAPCGTGKTFAAWHPGLTSLHRGEDAPSSHPPRMIHLLPMRALAQSMFDKARDSARRTYWNPEWQPRIQTGVMPDDPTFSGRVIFATVDQVMASFLNMPYGLPTMLDNLNAGAFIGAYLIWDEFHLYPRNEMLLTMLAMLKMLKGISRFTLMTATCSPPMREAIQDLLGLHVIEGPFDDIPALNERQRRFYAQEGDILDADTVRRHAQNVERTLVVVNTIDRAQHLYSELQHEADYEVILLHSRFYPEDRKRHEDAVIKRLGENSTISKPVIVIATQVVEVGLDISADILLTECAPASSIIQRAGRCARWGGQGDVHVFQPLIDTDDSKKELNYAPYLDDGFETICHKTWDALTNTFHDMVMDFTAEQRLIEITHGEDDAQFVRGLSQKIQTRIGEITDAMATRDPSDLGKLIRNNTSVPLWVHPNPNDDDLLTKHPYRRASFSVSKGAIARAYEALDADIEHSYYGGIRVSEDDAESLYPRQITKWNSVKTGVYSYHQFVVHPDAISYTPEMGLRLEANDVPSDHAEMISPEVPPRAYERPQYHAERYHEHITGLNFAYTKSIRLNQLDYAGKHHDRDYAPLKDEVLYPLRRLCGDDFEKVETLLRLTLALHDVGKLNHPFQEWSWAWQRFRAEHHGLESSIPLDDDTPLGHTDYKNNKVEFELQKALNHPPRGNHAVESAEAVSEIVYQASDGDDSLMAVALGAIMTHHTPKVTGECSPFRITPNWEITFAKSLDIWEFDAEDYAELLQTEFDGTGGDIDDALEDITPTYESYRTTFLYLIFVRILRLADQRSGDYWQRYGKDKLNG